MGRSRSIGWIAGTVVLMLALSALTYFLLYLPRAEDTAATLEEAEIVRAGNDILEIRIAQLAEQYEHLDEYKAELAALAVQIPEERDWDTVLEMINGFATGAGLPLPALEASVSDATPLTVFAQPGAQPAAPPADDAAQPGDAAVDQAVETGDDAEAAADAQDGTVDPPAPTGPVAVEGLTMVPFSVKVSGPHLNVMTFLNALQQHDGRLFFVGDFDVVRLGETDATDLRPAIADGDVELTARGFFFALSSEVPEVPSEEEPVAPGLPGSGGYNPFVPLEPSR